jgi:predicted GNAT family acetyltransferase
MASDQITVTNNRDASRFEVELDGQTAFADYRLGKGRITFPHTVVPDAFEGRGIGSALVRAGLQYARDEKLKVLPLCSFFAGYIERHPEYQDLVHPDYKPRS